MMYEDRVLGQLKEAEVLLTAMLRERITRHAKPGTAMMWRTDPDAGDKDFAFHWWESAYGRRHIREARAIIPLLRLVRAQLKPLPRDGGDVCFSDGGSIDIQRTIDGDVYVRMYSFDDDSEARMSPKEARELAAVLLQASIHGGWFEMMRKGD